jgi:acyl-CoA thioesterase FadM
VVFGQEIYKKDSDLKILDAKVIFVIMDMKKGVSVELEESLRKKLMS